MVLTSLGLVLSGGPWLAVVTVLCDGARHDTRASGFLVAEDVVATALHAVTGSEPDDLPRAVTVVTADGRRWPVTRVEALDTALDAALLRIPRRGDAWLRPAPPVTAGDALVVLPGPLGRGRGPLDVRVAGLRIDELGDVRYRVDQALRGRSGAPALDRDGRYAGFVSTTHELIPAAAVARLFGRVSPVTLREAHQAVAGSPHGSLDFARAAFRRGDRRGAEALLLEAIAREPRLADAHNLLGVLLRREGRTEEALAHYELAIRFRPSYGDAFRNLGLLQADLAVGRRAVRDPGSPGGASGPGQASPSPPVPDRTRAAWPPGGRPPAPGREAGGTGRHAAVLALLIVLPVVLYVLRRRLRRRA